MMAAKLLYTQMVGEQLLTGNPVFHGDGGKVRTPDLAGCRVDSERAGAAVTTAEIIETDDEKTVAVDGFARADTGFPPAWFAIVG